jgi:hypothetical protein
MMAFLPSTKDFFIVSVLLADNPGILEYLENHPDLYSEP